MKSCVPMVIAVAGLCVLTSAEKSQAQSQDEVLRRLEAKVDALSKENAQLRDRFSSFESSHRALRVLAQPTLASKPKPATAQSPAYPTPSETARDALAANRPAKAGAMSDCPAPRFQGAYVGVNGGGVSYTANRTDLEGYLIFPTLSVLTAVSKSAGGMAGGQIGYNWTQCNALWGVELDGDWASARSETNFVNVPGIVAQVTSRLNTMASARLRAGIAVDNLLFYVTGGLVAARTKTEWTTNFLGVFPSNETLSSQAWRWGWAAGFGTEWAFTERWSVRTEALYADFRDRNYALNSPILDPVIGQPLHFKNSDSMWIARLALNYKIWN